MTATPVAREETGAREALEVQARPLLRILLAEGLPKIEFRVQGPFVFTDLDGRPLLESSGSERCWLARIVDGRPAIFLYSVLIASFADPANAAALVRELGAGGYEARIASIGRPLHFHEGQVHDNRRYRVLSGRFEDEARAAEWLTHFHNRWHPRLVRERVLAPTGRIEFTDAGFEHDQEIASGFRILLPPGGSAVLSRLPVDRGLATPLADREFGGLLEFRVDNAGQLAVINEIHIDSYLKGVLPAELDGAFPPAVHRAQAVVARSAVLSMLGMKHMTEDWDFCATSHCQQYSGLTERSPAAVDAVQATQGQVLIWKDRICDAVYHACCGGHGESKENVWNTPAEEVLQGRPDRRSRRGRQPDLSDEAAFRRWILEPPDDAWCRVGPSELPQLSERSRKVFRWKDVFTRQELEELIHLKTGVDVGTLYDLVPVARGVSGRLIELEVIGSRRNLRLQKELKIREALSAERLLSSAFCVTMDTDEAGIPLRLTLLGAGSGHGVGLCQVGAAAMALEGRSTEQILAHYYPATQLKRIYTLE
jgi:stage II sporulation protein D